MFFLQVIPGCRTGSLSTDTLSVKDELRIMEPESGRPLRMRLVAIHGLFSDQCHNVPVFTPDNS